jgi:hypothetical protein
MSAYAYGRMSPGFENSLYNQIPFDSQFYSVTLKLVYDSIKIFVTYNIYRHVRWVPCHHGMALPQVTDADISEDTECLQWNALILKMF